MNWQALFDALLAGVALTVAWQAARAPALRQASTIGAGMTKGSALQPSLARAPAISSAPT